MTVAFRCASRHKNHKRNGHEVPRHKIPPAQVCILLRGEYVFDNNYFPFALNILKILSKGSSAGASSAAF